MAKPKPKPCDPAKRAAKAKRRKQRKAQETATGIAGGVAARQSTRTGPTDHGSSPRKRRRAREGEAMMRRDRGVDQ